MPLFDAYGRPVDLSALRREQAAPTMAGIRNVSAIMHPAQDLRPERIAAVLRTAELGDPWLYLEMAEDFEERDLHYAAAISTRKRTVSQLEVSVQPASQSKDDLYASDFVKEALIDSGLLADALFDVLDAIAKGFSVCEIMWDCGERRWVPERLVYRDPRWFMFDWISGEQILVRSLSTEGPALPEARPALGPGVRMTSTGVEIGIQPATAPLAPFKFLTHFGRAKSGLPIRGGLARLAAWAYLFKNYVLKDWVGFAETFGQPLRVGKYGPGAGEEDKQALLTAVANIGADAAAIIPQSMMIEFIEAKGREGTDIYERFCDWIDRQVSKGVLGQTLTTELPKGSGSRAAAEVHDVVRHDIASDDGRRVAASIRRDLVKALIDLNLPGPHESYPKIAIGFPDSQDLEALSNVSIFIDRGMRVSEQEIRQKFGLSAPAETDPVLHPVEKITGQDKGSQGDGAQGGSPEAAGETLAPLFTDFHARRQRNGSRAETPALDGIERFVARLREESDEAMAPIVRPLLEEMGHAVSYEDLKRRMVRAIAAMDTGKFETLMARAGFNVNVAGNLGIGVAQGEPRKRRAR